MTQFYVNRVSVNPQVKMLPFNGVLVQATIDVLEVELLDETGLMGTRTLRFATPDEIAAARATYSQGALVDDMETATAFTATLAGPAPVVEAAPAEPAPAEQTVQ